MGAEIAIEHGYIQAARRAAARRAHRHGPRHGHRHREPDDGGDARRGRRRCSRTRRASPRSSTSRSCLNAMGAQDRGRGHRRRSASKACARSAAPTHRVMPDRIETGTFLAAAAATGGDVRAHRRRAGLARRGARQAARGGRARSTTGDDCDRDRDDGAAAARSACAPRRIPGFPTDMQAQFMALARVADGTALDHRDHLREPLHARAGAAAPGRRHRVEGNTAVVHGRRAAAGRHGDGDRPARLGEPRDRRRSSPRARPWSTASTTSTAATSARGEARPRSARASSASARIAVESRPCHGFQAIPGWLHMASITIALSKGRIFDETAPLLARAASAARDPGNLAQADPRHQPPRRAAHHRARVRHADLRAVRRRRPRHRRQGRARRARRRGPLPAARPRHRACRMVVAVPEGLRLRSARCARARACASPPNTCSTAREHFAAKGVHVDLIKLYGSMELAPLVGLADAIVDLVSTGNTLQGERAGGGRGDHADVRAAHRQPGGAQAQARDAPAAARRLRQGVPRDEDCAASPRASRGFDARLAALTRFEAAQDPAVRRAVRAILADVRARGDAACSSTRGASTASLPRALRARDPRASCVRRSMPAPSRRDALRAAHERIRAFHEQQLQKSWDFTDADGTRLGQRVTPLDRVGLYVPGGKAAYPSSVLMNAMPAKVAGVREIVMACQPGRRATRWCWPRPRSPASTACSRSAARRRSPRSPTARKSCRASTRSSARATPTSPRRSATCSARSASTWSPARPRSW